MGVDIRRGIKNYPDRCKVYKGIYENRNKVTIDVNLHCVFYSRDKINYKQNNSKIDENSFSKKQTLTIETQDVLKDVSVGDYVLYTDNKYWKIENIEIQDYDMQKKYSKRPSSIKILTLRK